MELISIVTLAASAATLAFCIYLAIKMKAVLYALEQPIVKKMSPQLKLKPVKLDEMMADRNRQQQSPRPQGPQNGQRPAHQPGSRPPHGDRAEGERRPDQGRERNENRDRPDRRPEGQGRPDQGRDRNDGDRNRNNDRDRFRDRDRNRPQGGDRNRPPRDPSENRDNAPSSQPEQAHAETPAPMPVASAPLSPRRPLPSTVEVETPRQEAVPAVSSNVESGNEGLFNSEDVQHGRRTQMKKKPRFELDEAEVKATTEG